MENRELKSMIATGYVQEEHIANVVDELAESIARTFSTLANLKPEAAMFVLKELNSQLTQEEVDAVSESRNLRIESIMDSIDIDGLLE
tara:strand:+ start:302 stop:565 length:264 start_codon:yes stop_codon:yes gene_type:complete